MAYGKLGAIMVEGGHPEFAILDKDNFPATTIPSLDEWLLKRVGHTVSFTLTDKYFQVADLEEKE